MGTTPPPEIPADMRTMTEQSLEQVKTAINGYLQLFQCGVANPLIGGSEPNDKVVSYAEQNVASAFAFARKLLEVKNPQDLFVLQTEFIREQMQAMTEQTKDLSETAIRSIMNTVNIPTQGGPSSWARRSVGRSNSSSQ